MEPERCSGDKNGCAPGASSAAVPVKGRNGWILVSFIIASGLVIFSNLWGRTLENHDYLRYAEIAREMVRSGEWVVPRYNGSIYIDKPPLLFWLIAIPSWFHGTVTPFLARLPSALSAWIGVVLLFVWGRRIYGTISSGLISGGLLLTAYQYFFEARVAKTDMFFCLMVLFSLYFFYVGYEGRDRRSGFFYGFSFFFMGLGVLTKGPFGIAIPMAVMVAFLLKERKASILLSRQFLLGYLVFGLTVLPWVLFFVKRVGWDQSAALLEANSILTRKAPIYFYFIEIWGQFFPWSLLLPFLVVRFWKRRGGRFLRGESFLLVWFILLFVLLTFFEHRSSRYLLPALPPLALMMGGLWRNKTLTFLIPVCLLVVIWHAVDLYWVTKNLPHSPGKVLSGELRLLLGGSVLSGFRLDESTVEEINFYLDRVIPIIRTSKDLSGQKFVLMPNEVYRRMVLRGKIPIRLIREFEYKKDRLYLVSVIENSGPEDKAAPEGRPEKSKAFMLPGRQTDRKDAGAGSA